nr:response regulator transcription factor [Actinomadura rifamycini]
MTAPHGPVVRLLIVDDHPVVRDGLRGMFTGEPGLEVVGEAADGAEALRLAAELRPDVVLMDLRMPGMDGVTAITRLAESGSPCRVLVLTTYDTDRDVLPAIEAGATGYLLKDARKDELFRAVRAAARGEAVLSPPVATLLMSRMRAGAAPAPPAAPDVPPDGGEPLSPRELEVLGLVARGSTNREAAAKLFVSEATIKTHLLHIYAKLGVNDRAAAVGAAFERGLLRPGSAR